MVLLLVVVALVALVVFGVAAAVTRDVDLLPAVPPDLADPGIPAGRVEPADVDRMAFGLAFRGYRMDEVDVALDHLRDALAARDSEIARLRAGVSASPDPGE